MIHYGISATYLEARLNVQKKIKGNWVTVTAVNRSFIISDRAEIFTIQDSILVPLDSGNNYFRIIVGSKTSDEVSLFANKDNRKKVINGPEYKVIWNDWPPLEKQIIASGKLIRFNEIVWYSIHDKDGVLMKDGSSKFIDFSPYKKGNYSLNIGGGFFVYENK